MKVQLHLLSLLLFIMISLINTGILHGQQSKAKQEKVYLKDGSILKGQILEDNEFFIKILINTGDTLEIGYKNIIPAEQYQRSEQIMAPFYHDTGNFWNVVLKGQFIEDGGGELTIQYGKRWSSSFSAALGLGYLTRNENVQAYSFNSSYIHISPYARYYVKKEIPRLFFSASAGYALSVAGDGISFLDEEHSGGLTAHLSTGIHFASRNNLKWLIEAGVNYLNTSGSFSENNPWIGEIITSYSNKYLAPQLGIILEF